jgi:hypothetical protein
VIGAAGGKGLIVGKPEYCLILDALDGNGHMKHNHRYTTLEAKMGKKYDLPKGCQWPVKISAVITDIKTYRTDLEVRASTFTLQSYFQKDRVQMKKEGMIGILDCYYSPDGKAFPPSDTPLVDVWVRAVEKEAWASSRLQSEQIQRLVREHLDYVSSNEAWNDHWWLGITWLGKSKKIEFKSRINGTWKTGETITRLVSRDL